jgi:uncharacterized membrane protein
MRVSRAVLFLLAAAGIAQLVHYYPLLPEGMATHFDGSGRPNGFQSRDGFVALSASMLAMIITVFGGLGVLLRRIPSKWFNLPNREYRLAPERREETIAHISGQMEWFGVASLGLYLFVIHMVVETNRTADPRLDSRSMFLMVGLYLLFTCVWIARFVLRFRK